jgi:Putative Flp pilus-assembly TadE/G-like
MATEHRRSRERGMAIMMYAMMLFFVVAVVGLAVDVGTIFMIKARLSAAVDAAALAAGRSTCKTPSLRRRAPQLPRRNSSLPRIFQAGILIRSELRP